LKTELAKVKSEREKSLSEALRDKMSLLQDSYAALEKKIVVKPYKPI
jgi:hypothetical protein